MKQLKQITDSLYLNTDEVIAIKIKDLSSRKEIQIYLRGGEKIVEIIDEDEFNDFIKNLLENDNELDYDLNTKKS